MLDYLDLPIYDRELIYSFIQGQCYFEICSAHEKKFKPVLDWINNPVYIESYTRTYKIVNKFILTPITIHFDCYDSSKSFHSIPGINKNDKTVHCSCGCNSGRYVCKYFHIDKRSQMYVFNDPL